MSQLRAPDLDLSHGFRDSSLWLSLFLSDENGCHCLNEWLFPGEEVRGVSQANPSSLLLLLGEGQDLASVRRVRER